MNSNQAYALAKKIAEGAVSGVDSMSVDEQTLNIECNDGTHLEMTFPEPEDGVSIVDVAINNKSHLICTMSDGNTIDAGEVPSIPDGGKKGQVLTKKSNRDGDVEWKDGQGGGGGASALEDLTDVDIQDLTDGQILVYDAETETWVNKDNEGGGGDATLESDVTSNLAVGAIASGTTLDEGTTFTEFVQKLLITEIAPTINFSISKSGNVEYGSSYTETLTVSWTAKGTAKKIKTIAWYQGNTLLQTDTIDSTSTGSWTYTMESATTDTTTFKAIVTYVKSTDEDASTTKQASISFYYGKFYGGVSDLNPSEATVEALTKVLGTAKGGTYTFSVTAGRICYAYPKSLGALTSIKDGNGFSLFDSFTRTEQTYTQNSTSVVYYRYVLTDSTTVSGYNVVFA